MKIIHLTDPHLVPPGARLLGLDPNARLIRVLDHLRQTHADADLLVITGDLADAGDSAAYQALRAALHGLPMPVRLLMGNHDRRAPFRAAFPEAPCDENGFVQSVLPTENAGHMLFLDSLDEDIIGGRYCAARRDWLARALAQAGEAPVTVFVHHPPVDCGMAHFEHIGFHDAAAVMALLRAHRPGVRHMFFGHIHVPFSGTTADGIGFCAGRGTNHQFIQDLSSRTPFVAQGPLNYSVIQLAPEGVFVHPCDLFEAPAIEAGGFCLGP